MGRPTAAVPGDDDRAAGAGAGRPVRRARTLTGAGTRSGGSAPTGHVVARRDGGTAAEAVRALARTARVLERATGDLGLSQYRVLSAVAAGEERASRVAERFGLGRPAVSAAVEALCRAGLVCRAGAAADQRAIDLAVTPAGLDELDRVEGEMVRVLTDLCARSGTGSPLEQLKALAALGPALDDLLAERLARRQAGR